MFESIINLQSLFGAFVGGAFALLGQCLSSVLSRRTEHKRWVQAQRARVFERVVEAIAESERLAYEVINDETKSAEAFSLEHYLIRAWIPASDAVRSSLLYVGTIEGKKMSELVRKIGVNNRQALTKGSTTGMGIDCLREVRTLKDELNSLSQQALGRN